MSHPILSLALSATLASTALAQSIEASSVTVKEKILFFESTTEVPFVQYLVGKPAPTIVMAHGCNGPAYTWPDRLREWGYNVVVPNSFTARGYKNICNNTRLVTPAQRTRDIEEVVKWVEQQPWHQGKIGYMGFSHGGWTGQHIATNSTANIAAMVNYYPYCDHSDHSPKIPVQIHIGDLDDWTPANRCITVSRHPNYDLHVYKGVYHSFEEGNEMVVAGYKISYNSEASRSAESKTKAFFERHLK
jgi:dienelactone hydrolase